MRRYTDDKQRAYPLNTEKTILKGVKTHLRMGFAHVREGDQKMICEDYGKLKKWTTEMLEAWLRNVAVLRKRTNAVSISLDQPDNTQDDMYIQRSENLKCFSTPKFHRWRMKYCYETLDDYIHSKGGLRRQLEKNGVLNDSLGSMTTPLSFLISDGTDELKAS